MADESVPPSIALPSDEDLVAAGRARQAERESRVPYYNPDVGDIVDVTPEAARVLESHGKKTGLAEAQAEKIRQSWLGRADTAARGIANTASFGLHNLAGGLIDKAAHSSAGYLETAQKEDEENPSTAFWAPFIGGALTGGLRGFGALGVRAGEGLAAGSAGEIAAGIGGRAVAAGAAEGTGEAAAIGTLTGGAKVAAARAAAASGASGVKAFVSANKIPIARAIGLTGFEGAANAYDQSVALKQPITAEHLLQAAGEGIAYNALFNVGAHGASLILGGALRGAVKANDAVGLFKRGAAEGEGVASGAEPSFPSEPGAPADTPVDPNAPEVDDAAIPPMAEPTPGDPHPVMTNGKIHPNVLTLNEKGQIEFGRRVIKSDTHFLFDEQMRRMIGKKRFAEYRKLSNQVRDSSLSKELLSEKRGQLEAVIRQASAEWPRKKINGVEYPSFMDLRKERHAVKTMSAKKYPAYLKVRPNTVEPVATPVKPAGAVKSTPIPKSEPISEPAAPTEHPNPAEGEMHPAVKAAIDNVKHDPDLLRHQYNQIEKDYTRVLLESDKYDPGTPEYIRLEEEANQYHHAMNEVQEHLANHDPGIKPPAEPHAGKDLNWNYPEGADVEDKRIHLGRIYNKVLGKDGQLMQRAHNLARDMADAESDPLKQLKLRKKAILMERELHAHFPRGVDPETGKPIPGWRDLQKEFKRVVNGDKIEPPNPWERATPDQKLDIESEQHIDKKYPEVDIKGEDDATPNPVKPHVPGVENDIPNEPPDIPTADDADVHETPDYTKTGDPEVYPEEAKKGPYVKRFKTYRLFGLSHFSGPFRPLLHTAAFINQFGPFLLNNADPIANAVAKAANASNTTMGNAIKHAISAKVATDAEKNIVNPDVQYKKIMKMVNAAETNPESLAQGVHAQFGDDHPELVGNMTNALATALRVAASYSSRNPNDPTPRNSDYDPPRHEKVRVNKIAQAIFHPESVIRDPDPDTWAAFQQVHPETARFVQEILMNVVSNPKIKLSRQQTRNLSIMVGTPVTPQNHPDFLKSKQEAVSLMAVPAPPGKPGSSGGPGQGNAKVGQQLVAMTSPDPNAQLG